MSASLLLTMEVTGHIRDQRNSITNKYWRLGDKDNSLNVGQRIAHFVECWHDKPDVLGSIPGVEILHPLGIAPYVISVFLYTGYTIHALIWIFSFAFHVTIFNLILLFFIIIIS